MDFSQEESAAASPGSSIGPKKKGSYLRDLTTLQTAAAPPWELHGLQARVGRRIKHYARCEGLSARASSALWWPWRVPLALQKYDLLSHLHRICCCGCKPELNAPRVDRHGEVIQSKMGTWTATAVYLQSVEDGGWTLGILTSCLLLQEARGGRPDRGD